MLLPRPRRLAELVAQLGAVGVLRLPAHQPRPVGEQRLVDDLHPAASVPRGPPPAPRSGQEPRIDELAQDRSAADSRRDSGNTDSSSSHSRTARVPFGGDEVAEELAHDRDALRADAVHGRLGVPRQRAADAADVAIGLRGSAARSPGPASPTASPRRRRAAAAPRARPRPRPASPPPARRPRSGSRTAARAGSAPAGGPRRRASAAASGPRRAASWLVIVAAHQEVVPQASAAHGRRRQARAGRAGRRSAPAPRPRSA